MILTRIFSYVGYESFSPTGSIGILILLMGFIFTTTVIWIFINVNTDKESIADRNAKQRKLIEQEKKIRRLYPQSK